MIGILVILAVSWLILHFASKKNLLVLGFTPVPQRAVQFFIGLISFCILFLLVALVDTWWYEFTWKSQQEFSISLLGNSIWYYFKAVATEDLVFRGAILYILVKKLGPKIGIALSAIAFGIYHWFSYGLLNGDIQIVLLIYIFVVTGLMGLAWAYTFVKTRSLMMPLGMHLGWNQTQALFYEGDPYGALLYKVTERAEINEWLDLAYLLAKAIIIPLITIVLVRLYTKGKQSVGLNH